MLVIFGSISDTNGKNGIKGVVQELYIIMLVDKMSLLGLFFFYSNVSLFLNVLPERADDHSNNHVLSFTRLHSYLAFHVGC